MAVKDEVTIAAAAALGKITTAAIDRVIDLADGADWGSCKCEPATISTPEYSHPGYYCEACQIAGEIQEAKKQLAAIRALFAPAIVEQLRAWQEDAEKWRDHMRRVESVKAAMRAQPDMKQGEGMKVFRVVIERNGATTKEPGKVSTELMREEFRYAAETMQEVWDKIAWLRNDPERTLLVVHEEAPAITVFQPASWIGGKE